MLNKSNLLRWSYRLALIGSVFGLLASLNVAYVDWLEGQTDRLTGGIALGLSSLVLGISVILVRRLRRRSKELARRLDKLEEHDHKLVRFVLAMPQEIEQRVSRHTDTKLQEIFQEMTTTSTETSVAPSAEIVQKALERSLELLCWSTHHDGELYSRIEKLASYHQLVEELIRLGQIGWANHLAEQIKRVQRQAQTELREQFVEALRNQNWLLSLEVGELIQNAFPDSIMAREFESVRPRIARRIQMEINTRRSETDEIGQMPDSSISGIAASMKLKLTDQVAKSA